MTTATTTSTLNSNGLTAYQQQSLDGGIKVGTKFTEFTDTVYKLSRIIDLQVGFNTICDSRVTTNLATKLEALSKKTNLVADICSVASKHGLIAFWEPKIVDKTRFNNLLNTFAYEATLELNPSLAESSDSSSDKKEKVEKKS